MSKKIIRITLVLLMLISLGTAQATSLSEKPSVEKSLDVMKKLVEATDENITLGDYFYMSYGRISNTYVELESIEGEGLNAEIIEKCMDRRPPLLARFLSRYMVYFENMNFTLYFKKEARIGSRDIFYSISSEVEYNESGYPINTSNLTINYNTIHKVEVKNATGIFFYHRAKLIRGLTPCPKRLFCPPRFVFGAFAEEINYLE